MEARAILYEADVNKFSKNVQVKYHFLYQLFLCWTDAPKNCQVLVDRRKKKHQT